MKSTAATSAATPAMMEKSTTPSFRSQSNPRRNAPSRSRLDGGGVGGGSGGGEKVAGSSTGPESDGAASGGGGELSTGIVENGSGGGGCAAGPASWTGGERGSGGVRRGVASGGGATSLAAPARGATTEAPGWAVSAEVAGVAATGAAAVLQELEPSRCSREAIRCSSSRWPQTRACRDAWSSQSLRRRPMTSATPPTITATRTRVSIYPPPRSTPGEDTPSGAGRASHPRPEIGWRAVQACRPGSLHRSGPIHTFPPSSQTSPLGAVPETRT